MRDKKYDKKDTTRKVISVLTLLMLSVTLFNAHAQSKNKSKTGAKVYCWQENGSTQCGNIPPAQQAREINTKTGLSKNTMALPQQPNNPPKQNPSELVEDLENNQPIAEAKVISPLVQSLVANYPTEEQLLEHFKEKINAMEQQISILETEEKAQRKRLLKMLAKAGNEELDEKKISKDDQMAILNLHKNVVKLQQNKKQAQEEKALVEKQQQELFLAYKEAIMPYDPPKVE